MPTASQSPPMRRQAASSPGSSTTAQRGTTTRVAPAAKATSTCSGPSMPPATWSGVATARATDAMASRFTGLPCCAPSRSTRCTIGAPCATRDAAMTAGRSVGDPTPVEAPGHHTSRERPARTSRLGMTCIRTRGAALARSVRLPRQPGAGAGTRQAGCLSRGRPRACCVPDQAGTLATPVAASASRTAASAASMCRPSRP